MLYSSLPPNERTIYFKHTGETTGLEYQGEFKLKCALTVADRRRIELERSILLADQLNPSDSLQIISQLLSQLRIRVIEGPSWWKELGDGAQLLDEELLIKLMSEALSAEEQWKSALKAQSKKAAEGAAENPTTGS